MALFYEYKEHNAYKFGIIITNHAFSLKSGPVLCMTIEWFAAMTAIKLHHGFLSGPYDTYGDLQISLALSNNCSPSTVNDSYLDVVVRRYFNAQLNLFSQDFLIRFIHYQYRLTIQNNCGGICLIKK